MYNNGYSSNMPRSFSRSGQSTNGMSSYNRRGGERRENQYLPQEKPYRWNQSHQGFCRDLIDMMVKNRLIASGKLIKTIFDSYQRTCTETDVYTRFFVMYVLGSANHKPIRDNQTYRLEYNINHYIIPKCCRENDVMDDIVRAETDSFNLESIEFESRMQVFDMIDLCDDQAVLDAWNAEIEDGNHDWTAPCHAKFLAKAKEIICTKERGGNKDGK